MLGHNSAILSNPMFDTFNHVHSSDRKAERSVRGLVLTRRTDGARPRRHVSWRR